MLDVGSCSRSSRVTAGKSWTRRQAIGVLASGALGSDAVAEATNRAIERVVIPARPVQVAKYLAAGGQKRPAVLLLHGARGLTAREAAYDRYARDLASAGIDAWLFTYYRPNEAAAIQQAAGGTAREALYAQFVDGWVDRIRRVGVQAQQQDRSSGKVGILGFSLGGMVGVAAANGPAFSALAVFYASLPQFYRPRLTSLPPLLDIHGDADRSVPLPLGSELVAAARNLGGVADLAIFRGQGHGFDLDLANPASEPARRAAIAFLARWLGPSGRG